MKLKARKPEAVNPGKIKMLTYGKSGVGKTWLSMDFPAPYYIPTLHPDYSGRVEREQKIEERLQQIEQRVTNLEILIRLQEDDWK